MICVHFIFKPGTYDDDFHRLDGEIDSVVAIRVERTGITSLYFVRNPEKLSHVETETHLELR